MSEAKFIDPTKPLNPGLDYLALRQRGLDIIQQLAGQVWTDYNEHDPGVTTLELLCYALTELSYRAELPIEDLLADPDSNAIDPRRQGLLPPEVILPGHPVTVNDYRRLIADRVPAVKNVWLRPHQSRQADALNGLYDIEIYRADASSGTAQDPVGQVRRAYLATRGLCEDLHSIYVLEPIPTTLTTTVVVEPSGRPESVAARILYQVSCLLAPELRRQSLDSVLTTGQTPASIFNGPLPGRGFISEAQLAMRADRFTIGDIARVLREVPGVNGVHSVGLACSAGSIDSSSGSSALAVPPRRILTVNAPPLDAAPRIRIIQNGVEYTPAPDVVRRELDRLWTDHRREYEIRAECARLLSFPRGRAVDLRTYQLLQYQFPGVYGINEHGMPSDATAARRAQGLQLQAFLLVFDQLLADGFARLASATRGASRDPVYQYLDTSFPELRPLLNPSYRAGVRQMDDPGRRADRLSRIRRTLLAMYAETAEPLATASSGANPSDGATVAEAQVGFLRHLPAIGGRRGTAFDFSEAASPDNASGLEIRTRLQLGLRPETPPPLEETLRRFGLSEMAEAGPVSDRALMMRHGPHIDEHFEPIPRSLPSFQPEPDAGRNGFSEELLVAAAAPHHYRIGRLPDDSRWTVVCRAPAQALWQLAGTYGEKSAALAGAAALMTKAHAIYRQARRLYVVEHPLLRFAPVDRNARFDLDFTVSAVVCVPVRDTVDPGFRARVCHILRSNTPAHVVVHGCFLRFSRIAAFEALYWRWRDALRTTDGREEACRKLRDFLTPEPR